MATVVGASTSFTPGEQTCSTLVRQVLDFSQSPDDAELISLALTGLNAGIALINSRTWKKLYGTSSLTLDNTNREYAVPDDFKEPIRLIQLTSGSVKSGRLLFMTEAEFYELNDSQTSTTGSPTYYTFDYHSRVIVLDSIPSSSYTNSYPALQSRYHRRIPKLNCTGTTGLPPEFDEFLVARAAVWVARIRDPATVRVLLDESNERWRMLQRDDTNIQTDYQ